MWYVEQRGGKTFQGFHHTSQIDFDVIWDKLGLDDREKRVADRIINLYSSIQSQDQSSHYLTIKRLEEVAKDGRVITKLISEGLLQIHSKWRAIGHDRHPQVVYRLSISAIEALS